MRVLVCGGRYYDDHQRMYSVLDGIHEDTPITVLIEGGAKGADALAAGWANLHPDVEHLVFPADWETYGPAAGPIRNRQMLEEGEPDMVIAFPDPRSKGTWHMVNLSTREGVRTRVVVEEKRRRR